MEAMVRIIFSEAKKTTGFQGDSEFAHELFKVVEFLMACCVSRNEERRETVKSLSDRLYYRLAQRMNSQKDEFPEEQQIHEYLHSYFTERVEKTQAAGNELRFVSLVRREKLSSFSIFCLLVAIYAAENDCSKDGFSAVNEGQEFFGATEWTAARLYFGQRYPSASCCDAVFCAAGELAPLLWPVVPEGKGEDRVLQADQFLADYILGRPWKRAASFEPELSYQVPRRYPMDDTPEQLVKAFLNKGQSCIYLIKGEAASGRKLAVHQAAADLGKPVVHLNGRSFYSMDGAMQRNYFSRAIKLIHTFDGICCIGETIVSNEDALHDSVNFWLLVEELLIRWMVPVFITCSETFHMSEYFSLPVLEFTLKKPEWKQRKQLWAFFAEEAGFPQEQLTDADLSQLASRLELPAGHMKLAAILAREKLLREKKESILSLFMDSGVQISSGNLESKGKRIAWAFTWDDLVLAEHSKELLRNACNQVKYRSLVMDDWNMKTKMPYGIGLGILLYGPPGTGKTMTAQIMAKELSLPLYRIDLSRVVDKYVGETEKNIGIIFQEAGKSNAILFFDEADALFSRRSQVSNSNDRYANTETAYLLQCVEEYAGISILATNYQNNMDEAFRRRLKFMVEFPLPDSGARRHLWERMLAGQIPVGEIDLDFLGESYELSGGSIRNIVYNAAFLAAAEGSSVEMRHILYCLRQEIIKDGALFERSDFGAYEYLFW